MTNETTERKHVRAVQCVMSLTAGLFFMSSCSEIVDVPMEEREEYLISQKNQQASAIADSAGFWHNAFMDICLSNEMVVDSLTPEEIRKERINELAATYFSPKLQLTGSEVVQIIQDFVSDERDVYFYLVDLASTEPTKHRLYNKVLETYQTAVTAQEILNMVDSLRQSDRTFIDDNADVRAVLEIVEKSVNYWQDPEINIWAKREDPLTPRQRRIMNADGESAIQGSICGVLGGFVGVGVGCVLGGSVGSIWEAVFH